MSETASQVRAEKETSYKIANGHNDIFVVIIVGLVGIVSDNKRCTETMRILSASSLL